MKTNISPSFKSIEIQSQIEFDLQENATRILAAYGLNISDAINLFLRQVVNQNGLPFEVKVPNAVTRAAMSEANSNNLPRFESVQELFNDLEENGK